MKEQEAESPMNQELKALEAHMLSMSKQGRWLTYRNDPKFSDRLIWTNSADPDQTAPRGAVWSGSTLFAIPAASFGCITHW